ncbi:M23 family metallopeptidase [Mucilaginibacter sp. SJ]|uniref:M23 family metallopeptidase n=1 Tax=Mucilaginibacter sp. SJ TaxID=3029053 RepID=UPI0023A927E3|nr:M23 family metallopeptidase [Mucilaginibacter sp. SJ]WEA01716.1 M23 family metallopeptidase [Mucilaginibacter sp. SJ]
MKWLAILTACCFPLRQLHINSPFGNRLDPITGQLRTHEGLDLRARSDTVFAVLDGTVIQAGYQHGLGLNISISHGLVKTEYGHLSQVFILSNTPVTAGSPIGITGRSGRVTGEHLHFGVRFKGQPIDPLKFLIELNHHYHE